MNSGPILHSPRMSLAPYPVQPVTDDLVAAAARHPHKVAFIDGISGAEYTFAEILTAARRLGRHLQDAGVGVGDRVGIVATNSPEWAVVFLGTLFAGGTVTTLNPLYTEREIAEQFDDSTPKAVFVVEATAPAVKSSVGRRAGLPPHQRCLGARDRGRRRRAPGRVRPDDPSRGAAVLVGHHGRAQGRDALPSQPHEQRAPDPRVRPHRRLLGDGELPAVLPHLRHGRAHAPGYRGRRHPDHDARLRPEAVPRDRHRVPGDQPVHGAARAARAREHRREHHDDERPLHHVGRGAAPPRHRAPRRRTLRRHRRAGLRHDRSESGHPHLPARPRQGRHGRSAGRRTRARRSSISIPARRCRSARSASSWCPARR